MSSDSMIRLLVAAAFATLAGPAAAQMSAAQAKLEATPCPSGVTAASRCRSGRDASGAWVWLVVPADWNGTLVVHAHGGPELGEPKAARPVEDLQRWSIWNRSGFAYAGSGYRQGGVAVTSAAEDVERSRRLFVAEFGAPQRTILHGQSWGAGVAAKAAAMFGAAAPDGRLPYDAVLLSSGVLGGSQSYDFRLDLRVVYQSVCGNHPPPGEPAYPLWQGLPLESKLTRIELAIRVDECTGIRRKAEARSAVQQRNLETVTNVIRIPEHALLGHLNWATWHFQDIVFTRLAGRNPFGNTGVRYRGSADDDALNAKVERYSADPQARAAFAADTEARGRIAVPVLTIHAIDDPIAFVELESFFRDRMVEGGSGERLVQLFSADREHSYLSDAQYVAAMQALLDWVERGEKPTPQSVAARCPRVAAAFDPAGGCRFRPDYSPAALATRVAPR